MSELIKPATVPSVDDVVMRPDWLRAIGKAASSMRFTADNWEWMTESAKRESHKIADLLIEIENAFRSELNPPSDAWRNAMSKVDDSACSVGGTAACNGCGKPLQPENAWMEDGCPCNSPKGVNGKSV